MVMCIQILSTACTLTADTICEEEEEEEEEEGEDHNK